MKNIEFEVKIGLFVLAGIIILAIMIFSIGDYFFKPGYYLNVEMQFANGVREAAPVRLAGIEIGEVKNAAVFKDKAGKTKVMLKLWLMKEAVIEKDAQVGINTLGLIGEKYVEIIPGTPGTALIADGDTLIGSDSVSVEQITRKAYEVTLKLEKAVDTLSKILEQVKEGKGNVGMLLFNDSLYNEVQAMIEDLKAHPWKLLNRPNETRQKTEDKAETKTEDKTKKKRNAGVF